MWQQQQQYLRNLPSQHSQQQTLHPGIIDTDDHPHQSHHQHHHQHHQHHRTTIMNLPVPSNPRASRNMAEKQRRDNLNTNITNMAALVPIVAESSRKMDKISILRLAAAFLRTQYILGRGSTNSLPRQFNEFDLEQYFVDHIVDNGGFFLVLTAEGKIVYISRQVEQHLGYAQNELLGQSLYLFVYSEDHNELSRNLTPDGMQPMTPPSTGVVQAHDLVHDSSSSSSEDSTTNRINEKKKLFHEQRRNFKIRIAQRANSRRENTQYACFDISGVLRLAEACKNTDTNGNRGRHREVTSTKNDIVFVGVATFPRKRPINELSIMDANKDEYVTRHLIDGRIIFCDHRVSIVAGYMSEEVSGLNAFAFMHKNDCRWTMIGLRQMYDHADVSSCGSSCYRLLAKTGEFIYLRTHGYLEYEKGTKDVISFVCVNTLVSEDEGIQLIKEMKERFSATVSTVGYKNLIKNVDINSAIEMDSSSQSSNPRYSLEDPSQLEDAINHLINNMPSPAVSEDHFLPSPMQHTQYVKAALFSSRMPPVAAQANKIGINKIDHYIVIKGKGNRTPKQEPKEEYTNIGKYMNSSSAEQSPMSDTESVKSCTKPLILDMMNGGHNNHNNVQNADVSVQSNILANTRNTNNCRGVSRNHTSCLDVSQNTNGLNGQKRIEQRNSIMSPGALHESNIKLECEIETKQEPVLQYFDDRASDSSIVSPGIEATHNRCTLKRICSDEDLPTIHSKKRSNDALYMSTNPNDEQQQQRISYVNCETFATQNKYSAVEFNRYNDANLQPLITTAESPNSSLEHEIGKEYQQLVVDPTASLVVTNSDVQFDLRDLKDDTLLNSDLNANPELMLKIFNGLHNGPMTGFENRYNETKLQQFAPSHQTVVNDKLRRTYRQIASNITLQESQISMLANDFENPILHAQRKNLSQLQVEHNIQKRILKTLQQDHHKIQVNAKHNLGI